MKPIFLPFLLAVALSSSGCMATYTSVEVFVDAPGYFGKVQDLASAGRINVTSQNASWDLGAFVFVSDVPHGPTSVDEAHQNLSVFHHVTNRFTHDGQDREEAVSYFASDHRIRGTVKEGRSDGFAAERLRDFLDATTDLDQGETDRLVEAYLETRFIRESARGVSHLSVHMDEPLDLRPFFDGDPPRLHRYRHVCCLDDAQVVSPTFGDQDWHSSDWEARFELARVQSDGSSRQDLSVSAADRVYVALTIHEVGLSDEDAIQAAKDAVLSEAWPPLDFTGAEVHKRESSH